MNVATQLMNETVCYEVFLQFYGQIFSPADLYNIVKYARNKDGAAGDFYELYSVCLNSDGEISVLCV